MRCVFKRLRTRMTLLYILHRAWGLSEVRICTLTARLRSQRCQCWLTVPRMLAAQLLKSVF